MAVTSPLTSSALKWSDDHLRCTQLKYPTKLKVAYALHAQVKRMNAWNVTVSRLGNEMASQTGVEIGHT